MGSDSDWLRDRGRVVTRRRGRLMSAVVSGMSEYRTACSLIFLCSQSKTAGKDTGTVKRTYVYRVNLYLFVQ
jgi:hypothetical protein